MKQCQFGAQFYSNGMARVYIDPTRCFGCGVCRTACPHDAITMIPRETDIKTRNGGRTMSEKILQINFKFNVSGEEYEKAVSPLPDQ